METTVNMIQMIIGIMSAALAMATYNEDSMEEEKCDTGTTREHGTESSRSHKLFIDATIKEVA